MFKNNFIPNEVISNNVDTDNNMLEKAVNEMSEMLVTAGSDHIKVRQKGSGIEVGRSLE